MKKIILISILSLPLVACQPGAGVEATKSLSAQQSTSGSSSSTTTPPDAIPTDTGGLQGLAALNPSLGMKNFEQINSTMAAVTGIEVNTQVSNKFDSLKVQLPTDNDAKAYTFSAQGAATELAAEYCSVLVNTAAFTTQKTAAFGPALNFAAVPTVTYVPANRLAIAQSITLKFWGDGLPNMPAATLASHQQMIADLIGDLAAGEANTTATTRNVAVGACTAALSSAPVIML